MISALLRRGSTRAAFGDDAWELHAPARQFEEIESALPALARRGVLSLADARAAVPILLTLVRVVPEADVGRMHAAADAAIGRFDLDDVPFLAAALAVGADAIWSHDRHFDRQALVPRVDHPSLFRHS